MPSDEWYRPEYKGREDELISSQEILDRTGYTRGALNTWKKRHADMPKVVCVKWRSPDSMEGRGHGAFDRYWVRSEMEPFLEKRLELARVYRKPEDRDERYHIVSARIREDEMRIKWIIARETNLKDELGRLRRERELLQDRSVDDRRFLTAYERERNRSTEN
ncbi:hypothetical protein ADL22_12675 [Streptomyces sp. NRRL F-4489]|uniref:hypothetical protein n=1 Tax=Streptomyces sp. NRRL F-4489 TaxID=1609095 RepID=UPI000748DFE5|nr:hypothetical protein [Streptomyces sp. NRRL F-4489]KUL44791.1 hypothetical protein ADL22_12675 [Streptomyces sp. NRRL F-4489]